MRLLLASLVLLARTTTAQNTPNPVPTATFFISLSTKCQYGNASLDPGSAFREGGSLCAYIEEADIVYSCPAGNGVCWNTGGQCTGGSDTSAGSDQIACSDIGSGNVNWCCNTNYGNCTQTTFQENNCWSWFPNPNRGVNSLAASSSASVAMQIALATPSLANIVVSTSAKGGWKAAAAEVTSSISSSTSTTSSTTTTTPSTSAASSPTGPKSSISGGAIAGIAIAAALVSLIGASMGFFFWNRRQRRRESREIKELSIIVDDNKAPYYTEISHEKSASPLQVSGSHMAPAELPGIHEPRELSSQRFSRA